MKPYFLATATALLLLPAEVGAAGMTFDDLGFGTVYVENGITASVVGFGFFETRGFAHIDDSGTAQPYAIDFTMDGRFTVESLFLMPASADYYLCDEDFYNCDTVDDFRNVQFIGYDGDAVAADISFNMGDMPRTFVFGDAFADLTRFRTTINYPPMGQLRNGLYGYCADAPCTHYSFDDLKLIPVAPVPLPATLPMLAVGLAGIGALCKTGRRSA